MRTVCSRGSMFGACLPETGIAIEHVEYAGMFCYYGADVGHNVSIIIS